MDKKTIVITGSTRGIGYGLAEKLLEKGHQIVLNGTTEASVGKKVEAFQERGFEVVGVAGDVSRESCFQDIINKAQESFGKIDIWINNAGIPQSQKYFHELDNKEIEDLIAVNIVGSMMGTKAAILYFKKQGFGKIFNMEGFGSDGRIMKKLTLYGTSKRAIHYFTKSVSQEAKGEGIQIGILSPGMVRTDFLKEASTTGTPEEQAKNKKVFDILAEDVDVVTEFLANKILASTKQYDRIEFLTKRRLFPKIVKLIFVK
ncbi:MAG: SDR family oxidoreductase [Bacteroides sp.]|nr:SDR family oxidoreductase [Bacteroides sp.]